MNGFFELIDVLEKSVGPSPSLDAQVFSAMGIDKWVEIPRLFPLTQSVDCALALVSLKLPGWGYRIGTCCVSDDAFIFPDYNDPEHGERLKREFPRLPNLEEWADLTDVDLRPSGRLPIAILISLCLALDRIEKERR